MIEWDIDGYPTEASLERLKNAIQQADYETAIELFYAALRENRYGDDYCGPERVEVRWLVIDVWGYHTGGWSGNESIIATLKRTWLWELLLERYDRGGHYYFKMPR